MQPRKEWPSLSTVFQVTKSGLSSKFSEVLELLAVSVDCSTEEDDAEDGVEEPLGERCARRGFLRERLETGMSLDEV